MTLDNEQTILNNLQFRNEERIDEVVETLNEENVSADNPYHVLIDFKQGDEKNGYKGNFIIEEVQTDMEYRTFLGITIFTTIFGILVILLLKPLKRLTHGVEDNEADLPQQENFELGDENVAKS